MLHTKIFTRGLSFSLTKLSRDRIIILSTHIVSDIEYIANEILLMKDGRMEQKGTLEQILASMPISVWVCHVPQQAAAGLVKRFKISNMKSEGTMAELRILSPAPPMDGAVLAEPTLEDVFLYYFEENGGDDDGTL